MGIVCLSSCPGEMNISCHEKTEMPSSATRSTATYATKQIEFLPIKEGGLDTATSLTHVIESRLNINFLNCGFPCLTTVVSAVCIVIEGHRECYPFVMPSTIELSDRHAFSFHVP